MHPGRRYSAGHAMPPGGGRGMPVQGMPHPQFQGHVAPHRAPPPSVEELLGRLARKAKEGRRPDNASTRAGTFQNSVTQSISSLPYKGRLRYFLRDKVKQDKQYGWKFIKFDADEAEQNKQARPEEKSQQVLFDPVAHCEINLNYQSKKLQPLHEVPKSGHIAGERLDKEAHGKINYGNVKQYVQIQTSKHDLTHDFDVPRILSLALQEYCKNVLEKLYVSTQIRLNLPLSHPDLKCLVQKNELRPSVFIEEIRSRDEAAQKIGQQFEDTKRLKAEQEALEGGKIKSRADENKLQELANDKERARQVVMQEIKLQNEKERTRQVIDQEIDRSATAALGLDDTSLRLNAPINKKRKIETDRNEIRAETTMVDAINFLSQDKRFRKTSLLYSCLLNLGREDKIKIFRPLEISN